MKNIKLSDAIKHPERLFSELNYISYATNRDLGMSAEALKRLFPLTADIMERKYIEAEILYKHREN